MIFFGNRSSGASRLQNLRDNCSFYFGANTSEWSGNFYQTEVGNSSFERIADKQVIGVVDEAVSFTGDNNSLLTYNSSTDDGLILSDGMNDIPYSMSMWLKMDSYSGSQVVIYNRNSPSLPGWFFLYSSVTSFRMDMRSSSGYLYLKFSDVDFPLGQFNHIALTYNGDKNNPQAQYYINGSPVTTTIEVSNYTGLDQISNNLRLGELDNGDAKLIGALDEYGVFKNYQFTQEDVDLLHNNANGLQLF